MDIFGSNKTESHRQRAQNLRNWHISYYENFISQHSFDRGYLYYLKAYECMSDAQILLTEKRERKLQHQEYFEFVKSVKRSEESAKKSRHEVGARVDLTPTLEEAEKIRDLFRWLKDSEKSNYLFKKAS